MAKEFFVKKNRYQATFYYDPSVYRPDYNSLEIKVGSLICQNFCIGGSVAFTSRGKITLYFNPTFQQRRERNYAIKKITEAVKSPSR